jgi:sorting nexin-25
VEILHDVLGLSYFMEYMDRHSLMTLVQFWVVVDGFRNPLEDGFLTMTKSGTHRWTDTDRLDIAQINDAYLSKPELGVPDILREAVKSFIQAGRSATPVQYQRARSAILRSQTAVLDEMRSRCFPGFRVRTCTTSIWHLTSPPQNRPEICTKSIQTFDNCTNQRSTITYTTCASDGFASKC